uniref:Reverse transcriptase/retrotransposon-derived protein RNase H-like domain-containing protein n=1 Tax=Lactuca sativa TaxID=4236 RepID=A0A9R1VFW5_LACSA|nr:hypothetical protein LSAT_V11C500235590 [Lactuca sativa]
MEDECKPRRDTYRRLNPPMMEVVKKEILKLLDAGMIYPILNSNWLSSVQVVLKKTGITVVETIKGIIVPTCVQNGQRTGIPVFTKSQWHQKTKKRQRLHVHLALSHPGEFHLDCVIPRPLSNVVWLKELVTSAPIIQAPSWDLPLEIMCDARKYALGAVLG